MDSGINTSEAVEAQVGSPAPDFTLPDASGAPWQLSEHRGRVVALLFYPGDETLVCTRQELPMTLLTDEDRRVTKQYGAHWLFPIWTTRALVIVDAKGVVRHRHVVLRAFCPSDTRILTAINLAQYERLVGRAF